jgi:hypothetical protein
VSDDAVAYTTFNTGGDFSTPSADAVAYNVWSSGIGLARSIIGRVLGFSAAPRMAQRYGYTNTGVWHDFLLTSPGIAYSLWNQLEEALVTGSRTLEDTSPRLLEDGTTERTLDGHLESP